MLKAGAGQILSVYFTPTYTTNYNSVFGTTVTINVNKATPTVMWATPADITFGTALSGAQLNATASVDGTFVYSPPAGTILNAGAGQILSVDFTPTDTANYNSVFGTTVTINVNKATPTVLWANAADITFGTALSGTQLNATASVPGTFAYTPPAGTIVNAGAGKILSVDFTPTNTANYNSVFGRTVPINVNKAIPTNTPGKVNGGGVIGSDKGGNKVTFGFTINYDEGDSAPTGNLTFQDHKTNLRLKAISFDLLVIEGNQVWLTGTGETNDGQVVKFVVEIDALSKFGQPDTFYIYIPVLNGYESGGALTGGNIQISAP
jgi:ribosomal protein L14